MRERFYKYLDKQNDRANKWVDDNWFKLIAIVIPVPIVLNIIIVFNEVIGVSLSVASLIIIIDYLRWAWKKFKIK